MLSPAREQPPVDRTWRRRARGQALVELALILPIMLLLLAGAIDLGRAFYVYVSMQNAAREGAAYGILHPQDGAGSPNSAAITTVARGEMDGDTSLTVSVTCDPDPSCAPSDTAGGNQLAVTVQHAFSFVMPILPDLNMSTSASGVVMEEAP